MGAAFFSRFACVYACDLTAAHGQPILSAT